MNRNLLRLAPALLLAGMMMLTTAIAVAAPAEPWTATAVPLLLAAGLLGADLLRSWIAEGRSRVASGTLLVALAIVLACGAVASRDPGRLAGMIPIFGACAAVPLLASRGDMGKQPRRAGSEAAERSTCSLV